jgi:hypothetical protein
LRDFRQELNKNNKKGNLIMKNNQNYEKYEVFATVTIPVSVAIQAKSENEALEKGQIMLSQDDFIDSKLSLIDSKGDILSLKTHDLIINVNQAIKNY